MKHFAPVERPTEERSMCRDELSVDNAGLKRLLQLLQLVSFFGFHLFRFCSCEIRIHSLRGGFQL